MTADVVAFLRAALDEVERVAQAATDGPWTTDDEDPRGTWVVAPEQPAHRGRGGQAEPYLIAMHRTVEWERCDDEPIRMADARHIALHDPRAALARVQAERQVVNEYEVWDAMRNERTAVAADLLLGVVRMLAYGHRHTVPGYDPAWAPEGAEVPA